MKNNTIGIGLSLGLGVYIYEVINNLLKHQSLSNALTDVDWKRVLFMSVFGAIIYYFFYKKSNGQ
jgi:hypothetical protein